MWSCRELMSLVVWNFWGEFLGLTWMHLEHWVRAHLVPSVGENGVTMGCQVGYYDTHTHIYI